MDGFSFPMDDEKEEERKEEVLEKIKEPEKDAGIPIINEDIQSISVVNDKSSSSGNSAPRVVDKKVHQIRDFPAVLLNMARTAIPNANNKTDALSAFIVALLGDKEDLPLPPYIFELARGYAGNDVTDNVIQLQNEIRLLRSDLYKMNEIIFQNNVMLTYILAERTAMLKHYASNGDVKTIDYTDSAMERLREHTVSASSSIFNELRYKENLIKREQIYRKKGRK